MHTSHYRRNFIALTLDGVLFFFGMIFISLDTVLPLFLNRLGASSLSIAAVPVAAAVGVHLPSLFVAGHVESLDRKLPFTLRSGIAQRLPWTIVAVLIPLFAVDSPRLIVAVVLGGVVVTTMAAGISIPGFFDVVSSTVPVERRGTLVALRSILSYLSGIGGGVAVRAILERVRYPWNYSILFFVASILLFVGLWTLSRLREPERTTPPPDRGTLAQRIRRVLGSSASFRRYIVMRGILVISFAATGFFPVYLAQAFALTDGAAGLFSVITAVTFVIVNPIFGRIANRIGYKALFAVSFVSLIGGGVIGLADVSQPVAYLMIALASISRSVNLLSFNMTVEFAPPGQVPSYIGVSGLFIGIVAPLALFLGGIVDWFGYGVLFVVTIVLSAAGLLVLLVGVTEPRRAYQPLSRPDVPA